MSFYLKKITDDAPINTEGVWPYNYSELLWKDSKVYVIFKICYHVLGKMQNACAILYQFSRIKIYYISVILF